MTVKLLRDILLEVNQNGHETVHHISPEHNIDKFHALSHFGTYKAARQVGSYANARRPDEVSDKANYRDRTHYKARLVNKGNVHHLEGDSVDHSPNMLLHQLHYQGVFNKHEFEKHTHALWATEKKHGAYSAEARTHAANIIRSKGIHTLSYTNKFEHPGRKSYIITHPDQVHMISKTKIKVKSTTAPDKTGKPAFKA